MVNLVDNSLITPEAGESRGYSNTLPYKLRGAYSSGEDVGIHIPDLILHHSFTLSTWIYMMTLRKSAVFSKNTDIFTSDGDEDFLYVFIYSDGSFGIEYYTQNSSTDHFELAANSDSGKIKMNTWYML